MIVGVHYDKQSYTHGEMYFSTSKDSNSNKATGKHDIAIFYPQDDFTRLNDRAKTPEMCVHIERPAG